MKLKYRNEWKYLISLPEAELLKRRLLPFMEPDPHAGEDGYLIRSLYFDDWKHSAYEEKLMGVMHRTKWRIRIYNYSDSSVKLERKMKSGSYIHKDSADLTRRDVENILDGNVDFLAERDDGLCREFYFEYVSKLLRPEVIVDYDRVPLIYDAGTVRITFDRDVRAAVGGPDLFDASLPTFNCLEPEKLILEVKFTEFLPQLIRQLLPTNGQEFTAMSKYVLCRDRVHHLTDPVSALSTSKIFGRIRDEYT